MAAVVRLLPSIRPQMASLTPPLLIFQHALCGHHLEKRAVGGKNGEEERCFEKKRRRGRGWLKLAAKHSPNNRFPNTSSGEVGWTGSPGVHQQWVSYLVNIICLKFLTRSPLPHPSLVNAVLPLRTPLHIFTLPPPHIASLPCAEARLKFTTTVKVRDDR